jgi:D-alanyl-D-alanine carboxypeptidase
MLLLLAMSAGPSCSGSEGSLAADSEVGAGDVPGDAVGNDGFGDGPAADAATDAATQDGTSGDALADVVLQVSPELAGKLQATLEEFLAFVGEPGTTAAVRLPDGAWWTGAVGVTSLQDPKPMTPETGFRIGSGTKPFVAALVLQLVDEGKLSLSDPLGQHLPDYPAWEQVTIAQLLGMEAGLPDYLVDTELWLDAFAAPGKPFAPEALLEYVKDDPLDYPPGEGCAYSNTNYILLGLVVEKVTGNPVEQELKNRIIEPLGLAHTFLDGTGEPVDWLAHGYADVTVMGAVFGIPEAFTAFVPAEYHVSDVLIDCTSLFHPSVAWAAGAMVSNVHDMVVFMRAALGAKLFSEASLAAMKDKHSCQLLGSEVQYGLGLLEYATPEGGAHGHGGLNFGYESSTLVLNDSDLALSHMHNYLPEQSWGLNADLLTLAAHPETEMAPKCVAPEGFLAPPQGVPSLQFGFKGMLASDVPGKEIPGIGTFRGQFENKNWTLYGLYAGAKLTTAGLQQRVEVDALGPGDGKKVLARYTVLSVAAVDIASTGQDRVLDLTSAAPYTLFGFVANIAGTQTGPQELCVVAVPSPAESSSVFVCGGSTAAPAVGETVKLFGNVEMTMDTNAIDAYLAPLKIPRCLCREGTEAWAACEDGV